MKYDPMKFDPFLPFTLSLQAARIGFEAQTIIAMRLAGMAGFWNVPRTENTRMVVEKAEAAMGAIGAATNAALGGKGPEEMMSAGMNEIGRYTSRNYRRLTRRGPKLG